MNLRKYGIVKRDMFAQLVSFLNGIALVFALQAETQESRVVFLFLVHHNTALSAIPRNTNVLRAYQRKHTYASFVNARNPEM